MLSFRVPSLLLSIPLSLSFPPSPSSLGTRARAVRASRPPTARRSCTLLAGPANIHLEGDDFRGFASSPTQAPQPDCLCDMPIYTRYSDAHHALSLPPSFPLAHLCVGGWVRARVRIRERRCVYIPIVPFFCRLMPVRSGLPPASAWAIFYFRGVGVDDGDD